jgi:hypothetical protein
MLQIGGWGKLSFQCLRPSASLRAAIISDLNGQFSDHIGHTMCPVDTATAGSWAGI